MIEYSDTLALVVEQESSVYELELSMITITKAEHIHFKTLNLSQIKQPTLITNATTLSNHPTGLTCDTYKKNTLDEINKQNMVLKETFILFPSCKLGKDRIAF